MAPYQRVHHLAENYWASSYARKKPSPFPVRSGIVALKRHFGGSLAGKRFLDLGCGTGSAISRTLVRMGATVVGVDAAFKPLRAAKARKLAALQAEAGELPFHDRQFDGVISSYVYDCYSAPGFSDMTGMNAIMAEHHRVLKPGGMLLLVTSRELHMPKQTLKHFGFSLTYEKINQRGAKLFAAVK